MIQIDSILISLGVCVALPCIVVYLVTKARRHEINRKTEVALKAIECGAKVDPNFFAEQKQSVKSVKARTFAYLKAGLILGFLGLAIGAFNIYPEKDTDLIAFGGIIFFLGIAFTIIYFISRKHFAAEIEAEEKNGKLK